MKMKIAFTVAAILFAGKILAADTNAASFRVDITVDAAKPLGELKPIWRMFGADEPNYATMKDGRKLIGELGALKPHDVFFRTHNLLCSGDICGWIILRDMYDVSIADKVTPVRHPGHIHRQLSVGSVT